jgi:hypothetical protein
MVGVDVSPHVLRIHRKARVLPLAAAVVGRRFPAIVVPNRELKLRPSVLKQKIMMKVDPKNHDAGDVRDEDLVKVIARKRLLSGEISQPQMLLQSGRIATILKVGLVLGLRIGITTLMMPRLPHAVSEGAKLTPIIPTPTVLNHGQAVVSGEDDAVVQSRVLSEQNEQNEKQSRLRKAVIDLRAVGLGLGC